jgi:hypothetical protein
MICAYCHGEITGDAELDEEGREFFALKPGQEICYWCIEAWSTEPQDLPVHGRA